jgi:predicted anti-sigma-YlaC factor YlaD
MIVGAVSIGLADPGPLELHNWKQAMNRECLRYGLDMASVAEVVNGDDPFSSRPQKRRWWELLIVAVAVGIFVWLGLGTCSQHLDLSLPWMIALAVGTLLPLGLCGTLLWRRTRFS